MLRKSIFLYSLLFFSFCFGVVESHSQCVRVDNLKTNSLTGRTIAVYQGTDRKDDLPGVSIVVSKETKDDRVVVVEGKTDSNGLFAFSDISPGKYIFEAFATNFDKISLRLKITRRSRNEKRKVLLVALGPTIPSGTDSCEGYVTVEAR